MAQDRRTNDRTSNTVGVYLGKVVNHLDTTFMGGLQVEILRRTRTGSLQGETVNCKYASPFAGQTPYAGLGYGSDYASTQKSYGFWAVPPDIGTQVIVLMPEGDFSQAFWVGCVADVGMNFSVPGNAGTTYNDTDPSKALPVAEYNKRATELSGKDPTQAIKPVPPERYKRLDEAGLASDHVRGTNTSSARRESPSTVFGISTPGPLDLNGPKHAYGPTPGSSIQRPFSRLGGHSFIMDDGDLTLQRKAAAGGNDGDKLEYANFEKGDKSGKKEIPANEMIKLQTRTGHQIMMNCSEDLIYIAHGSGKSWIEMTSNGKIDIYSEDSISVNSDNDLNLNAGRNINMSATENINIISDKNTAIHSLENTSMQAKNFTQFVEEDFNLRVDGESNVYVKGNHNLVIKDNYYISVNYDMETKVNQNSVTQANTIKERAMVDHTIGSNNLYLDVNVEINGEAKIKKLKAGIINNTVAGLAWEDKPGTDNQILSEFSFGYSGSSPGQASSAKEANEIGDGDKALYPKRIPLHEPWEEHENLDPKSFKPDRTLAEESERPKEEESKFQFPPIDDTFKKA